MDAGTNAKRPATDQVASMRNYVENVSLPPVFILSVYSRHEIVSFAEGMQMAHTNYNHEYCLINFLTMMTKRDILLIFLTKREPNARKPMVSSLDTMGFQACNIHKVSFFCE